MGENGRVVGLALGSGGARGYAHIGAIEVLKDRGYSIGAVSGTSMGSLVGGLEAAGRLPAFTEWARSLTQAQVIRLLDPALNAAGAFRATRVLDKITTLLEGVRIEDLPIPYTAVATDLNQAREVWFREGPLDVAIRASIAIPSMVTPIVVNGRLLVDGAVLNPVPIEPLTATSTDLTVAVAIGAVAKASNQLRPIAESADTAPREQWLGRLRRGLLENETVRALVARFESTDQTPPPFTEPPPGLGIIDVTNVTLDIMGAVIARYRMAAHPPDVLVEIPGNVCHTFDFHRAAEAIEMGRRVTALALDRYEGR